MLTTPRSEEAQADCREQLGIPSNECMSAPDDVLGIFGDGSGGQTLVRSTPPASGSSRSRSPSPL